VKDVLIVIKSTLIGLFIAVFFYPLIHESGHILATLITGGKLVSISWLPEPNVLCEIDSTNTAALAITSLAGMVFPMVFLLPFYKSKGYLRLGALVFNAITVLSMLIGLSVAFLRFFGITVPNDDVTAFIEFTEWILPTMLIMIVFSGISIFQFLLFKPKQTLIAVLSLHPTKQYSLVQHSQAKHRQ
jgi:hypothetical protein